MAHEALTQAELEAVRKLLSAALVETQKLTMYEESCQDSELKVWLRGEGKAALLRARQLYTLLGGSEH